MRFPRFRLRTLMTAVAVVAAVLGLVQSFPVMLPALVVLAPPTVAVAVLLSCRPRRRHLLAAWVSPVIPLVTVFTAYAYIIMLSAEYSHRICAFGSAAIGCLIGLVLAVIGLSATKENGALATIPAGMLGLLLSAGLACHSIGVCGIADRPGWIL